MIIDRASKNGGPFASSLGVVELIIALMEVFDFEQDTIVFDIGHQYQAYKILTGRKEKFYELGKKGGLTRYPDISESRYDFFTTGHAGTSVSAALGYALTYPDKKSIALVGDGSLTSGQIHEALNHAGALQPPNLLVIINQNGWSIDKNVGALSDGENLKQFAESLKFKYYGVVDGHDIGLLIKTLKDIKNEGSPILFHVKTIKGKGCTYAEEDPATFHHPFFPFNKETGKTDTIVEEWHQDGLWLLESFSRKCAELISRYDNIYFTSPAYLLGGYQILAKAYPTKVIDTGISEQHCMTLSTALGLAGNKVIMSLASFFLPRCYDQIFDLCIQNIPIVVFICFPGIRPSSCATHQATFDISALRTIPNLTLMHPKGIDEFMDMLDYAVEADRPIFIHGSYEDCTEGSEAPIEHGKAVIEKEGDAITIVPIGAMFKSSFEIAKSISGVEIINPRFLKPFDYPLVEQSVKKTKRLLIIEDGIRCGGLGEGILAYLKENNIACKAKLMTIPDRFIKPGTWEEIFNDAGLTVDNILESANNLMGASKN
jgi:1-deoxy-D-xylulose-5-phosphate synthase